MERAMVHNLKGEVIVITGAGRGIGAAAARVLAAHGARVVVSARRQADAQAVAASIAGGEVLALGCDVGRSDEVASLVGETERRFGPPSVLVNNAGVIAPIGRLDTIDPEAFAGAIRTTLVGAVFMAQAVLPAMAKAGRGRIINLSSGAAHRPMEGWSAYCAAKAGLAMLTRSIALEYGERGVKAFGFAPGVVDTGMQAQIRASGINPVSQLPREALAPAEQPAEAIAFLCSAASDAYAGQEIDIRAEGFREAAGLPPI
jgi:NAD(P)-dependent dehydrogenase (short-subunit alcohol dehydrogenase family)